ncbi:MAG: CapA family protein [Desulfobacterium sp.]|nr:CapA family protein [Desulfobacterium sp.]
MNTPPIKILFAGDFIPPQPDDSRLYSEDLLNVLSDKDFSIVNLEAPLTRSSEKIQKTGNNFKSHPETIQHIVGGKFDTVALANNHIRDFGRQGVLDTLETCQKNNILTMGAGENLETAGGPLIVTIKEKKMGFLNFCEKEFNIASQNTPGANPFDTIDAFYQIQKAKSACDFVFVVYHGGLEYHYLPTPGIIKRFKFLIDAGADGVVSHHTHRYSGTMKYRKRPIFFGLGNFFASTISKVTDDWLVGAMAMISIDGDAIEYQMVPTKMARNFTAVDVLLNDEKQKVMAHIDTISSKISNVIEINKYWDEVFQDEADRTIALLKSGSRMEFRIRKRLPMLWSRMSPYKLSILLNLVRCDSHREKLIEILNNEYKNF